MTAQYEPAPATIDATMAPVASIADSDYLTFHLGEDEFCLPVSAVQEIRTWSQPTPLPRAEPALLGVINLRGTILPVIDLACRLGLPLRGGFTRRVIVVTEHNGRLAGVVVDRVADIVRLPTDAISPPPSVGNPGSAEVLAGLILSGERMFRLLSPAALMAQEPTGVVA